MLIEDAADSGAAAVRTRPVHAATGKAREGNQRDNVPVFTSVAMLPSVSAGLIPCMRENRFSGTRGQTGGGGASAGGRGQAPPRPINSPLSRSFSPFFLVFVQQLVITNSRYKISPVQKYN